MVLILMVLWLFTQGHAINVRLTGGRGPWEGRLEINHNGSWETVCYREFRLNDAKVVCHMLGYQRVIAVFNRKRLSSGNDGHIMLNNILCTGNEDDIGTCPSSEWFKTNCDYHSDVGLNCVRHGLEPVEGVRLVGGTGPI
ncbi:Hypothetical predicted protein [Mytilus galloprovincialis]|uniref:SRCR domain-containing protein n=1 Tax=Mytilus galloprovincialis TaxID=29158 RepID=A0A8B6HBA7_MYTGA|nr:Hypothetical predicted protein [Mytilus galloprovincialis]